MLESHVRIAALVRLAKEYGYQSLAITDANLHGSYKFYQACQAAGIKPIIGYETQFNNQVVVIYPTTNEGYEGLLRYATDAQMYPERHVDWIVVTRGPDAHCSNPHSCTSGIIWVLNSMPLNKKFKLLLGLS